MFYALTQKEEDFYESRINLFVALAPVTRLRTINNELLEFFSNFHQMVNQVTDMFGVYEFFGPKWIQIEQSNFCKLTLGLCKTLRNSALGSVTKYNEKERVELSN